MNLGEYLKHETVKHSLVNVLDFVYSSIASFLFLYLFFNYSSPESIAVYYQFFAVLKIIDILFSAISFSNVDTEVKSYIGFYWILGLIAGLALSYFLNIYLLWGTLTALFILLLMNAGRYFFIWQDLRRLLSTSGQATIKLIVVVTLILLNHHLTTNDVFMATALALSPVLLIREIYAFPRLKLGTSKQGWAMYYLRVFESTINNIDNSIMRFFEQPQLVAEYNLFAQIFKRFSAQLPFSVYINIVKRGMENTLGPKTIKVSLLLAFALSLLVIAVGIPLNYWIFPYLFPNHKDFLIGNLVISLSALLSLTSVAKFLLISWGKRREILKHYFIAFLLYLLTLIPNIKFGAHGIALSYNYAILYLAIFLFREVWKEIKNKNLRLL
jgi:uncharacterized membrane protein (Fun14 family)